MGDSGTTRPPSAAQALFLRAVELQKSGRIAEAAELYGQVLASTPGHYPANLNLGVALRRLKRPQEALAAYDRAVALRPGEAGAHSNRANLLRELRRLPEALESLDRALELSPGDAMLHSTRAGVLQDAQRPDEALAGYDRALEIDPNLAEALNGRGTVLFVLDRLEEALAHYDRAIAAKPGLALAHRNRGVTLRRLRRPQEAIESHDRALALAPDTVDAYWYRSICRLLIGDFDAGWRDYERRWQVGEFVRSSPGETTPKLRARFPASLGRADLMERDVLLIGEQGVGDVIMFASVLPDLLADAKAVSLACDKRLWGLLAHSFPRLVLLDKATAEARAGDFDVVAGIGSLPSVYRSRLEDFPGVPYLSPGQEARARWAGRMGPAQGRKRIGLSWRGGAANTGREARSIPLQALRPILDLPDCEFVSLQYGNHDDEIAAANVGLERPIRTFPKDEIDDFEDLAALVGELDLVISVQTSIVHLSGAVGAPALVMVPATPEWRYMNAGPSMPWYRSIALFRQGPDADWAPVIAQVAAAAADRLGL